MGQIKNIKLHIVTDIKIKSYRMDVPSAYISFTFQVEKITGVAVDEKNNKSYEVQWAPNWVSSCNLIGCEKLIEQFLQQQTILCDVKDSEDSFSNQMEGINMIAEIDSGDEMLQTCTLLDQQLNNHQQHQDQQQQQQ